MTRPSEQEAATRQRGDTVQMVQLTGHRVRLSLRRGAGMACAADEVSSPPWSQTRLRSRPRVGGDTRGFTLIELVISITVLTILTLGVVPLVKVSIKRQREQQLHESLRTIRAAIDQFHREALLYNCALQTPGQNPQQQPQPQQAVFDPRIKVAITDCTIFGVDNPDHYPPDLDTLVNGVNVIPISGLGGRGQPGVNATDVGTLSTKKKVYLRAIPIDPVTGKAEWDLRSCYDAADSDSWGGENVFDVRSKSKDTALNGEKYSDW